MATNFTRYIIRFHPFATIRWPQERRTTKCGAGANILDDEARGERRRWLLSLRPFGHL